MSRDLEIRCLTAEQLVDDMQDQLEKNKSKLDRIKEYCEEVYYNQFSSIEEQRIAGTIIYIIKEGN